MSDDTLRKIKALARDILILCEDVSEFRAKEPKAEISPKKEATVNTNPQQTESGISWSFQGDLVLFKVDYKFKNGFKKIVKDTSKGLAKWDKGLKLWKLEDRFASNELFLKLQEATPEWLEAQEEEHIL